MINLESAAMNVNPFASQDHETFRPKSQDMAKPASEEDMAVSDSFRKLQKLRLKPRDYSDLELVECSRLRRLDPPQISHLLYRIIHETDKKDAEHRLTGLYLTEFIKRANKRGYRDFTLNTEDLRIDSLCDMVRCKEGEEATVRIIGDTAAQFGRLSKFCSFEIFGCSGNALGNRSDNCRYHVHGDAGNQFGLSCNYCYLEVDGDVGQLCGRGARDSVFATKNPQTYEKMVNDVEIRRYNSVILLDGKGNTLKEARL